MEKSGISFDDIKYAGWEEDFKSNFGTHFYLGDFELILKDFEGNVTIHDDSGRELFKGNLKTTADLVETIEKFKIK